MPMHLPRSLLIGGVLILTGQAAGAQTPAAGLAQACRQDAQQFCNATQPSSGALRCLREHAAELSPGCGEALQERHAQKAAAATVAQAGQPPAPAGAPQPASSYPPPGAAPPAPASYPPPTGPAPAAGYQPPAGAAPSAAYPPPGGGAPGGPYPAPGAAYPATRPPPNPARMEAREACRMDFRSLCAGVQPGGGRIVQCLHAHAPQLSPACTGALEAVRAARQGGGYPPQ